MGSAAGARLLRMCALGSVLLAGGCGGGTTHNAAPSPSARPHGSPASRAARAVPGTADAESVRVISAWALELMHGRIRAASRLFALPSRVQVSVDSQVFVLRRRAEVVAFNSVLPCGARLLRADRRGRFVNALFVLSNRADSPCDAPGASARVAFVVRRGLIAEWYRARSEAGDPGGATPAPGTPGAPATPNIPGAPAPPGQQTPTTPDTPVPGAPVTGPVV